MSTTAAKSPASPSTATPSRAELRPGSYCLYCYAPLEASSRASTTCGECDQAQLRADQKVYWSREASILELQYWLQFAAIAVPTGISLWMLWPILAGEYRVHAYRGAGFHLIVSVLIAVLLWDSASLLTRRRSIFRADLIWASIAWVLGGIPIGVMLLGMITRRPFRLPRLEQIQDALPVLLWSGFWIATGLLLRAAVGWLSRRRDRYFLRRIEAWL